MKEWLIANSELIDILRVSPPGILRQRAESELLRRIPGSQPIEEFTKLEVESRLAQLELEVLKLRALHLSHCHTTPMGPTNLPERAK